MMTISMPSRAMISKLVTPPAVSSVASPNRSTAACTDGIAAHAVSTDFAHPVDFLVPGVLSLAVMASAMVSLGIATGFERRYGVLKRLGSTPLSRGGLLVAKTATVLALEVLQIVLVVLVGIAIGWSPPGGLVPVKRRP